MLSQYAGLGIWPGRGGCTRAAAAAVASEAWSFTLDPIAYCQFSGIQGV